MTTQCRWLFIVLLLTAALVATACGGLLVAQAAVPGTRGGAQRVEPQDSPPASTVSSVAPTEWGLIADSLAAPETVIYRVGQTAVIGILRVTLDKVVVTAGEAGNGPEAGQRFLLVYITVENTSIEVQALSSFSTSVTDAAGRHYFVEPRAGNRSAAQPLNASIAPGGQVSGNRGYMLPVDAGDLIWAGEDESHRATFAVSTTDIVALRAR